MSPSPIPKRRAFLYSCNTHKHKGHCHLWNTRAHNFEQSIHWFSSPVLTVAAQQNPEQNTLSVYPPPFLISKQEWWSFNFRSWTSTTVYQTYTNLQLSRNDSTYNSVINTVGCILLVSPVNRHFDSMCGIYWYRLFTGDSLRLIVQSETDRPQEWPSVTEDRESCTITHCHDIIDSWMHVAKIHSCPFFIVSCHSLN